MRITITPEEGSPFVLCDHGRESASGFTAQVLRSVEALRFVQATYSKPKNRGNALNQITFSVTKEHATYTAAQEYLLSQTTLVPTSGTLVVELEDQARTMSADDATVEVAPLPILGVKTTINYTLKYAGFAFTG